MYNWFGIYSILITAFLSVKAQYSLTPSLPYALKNKQFSLECNLGPSSTVPSFGIIWRRNNVPVVTVTSRVLDTIPFCNKYDSGKGLFQFYTYSCADNRTYNLHISESRINNEDNAAWTCTDGAGGGASSSDYTIRVYAQYRITTSGSYAVKNKEFMLTCNIGPSSPVPSFAITWNRNNKIVVVIQTVDCRTFDPVEGLFQYYTYNCTDNRTYNIYISGTRINVDDGSVWRCGDNSDLSVISSDYTLIVYDPPTGNPLISGYNGTTTYLGNTLTLTCTLNGGNPLSTLTWTCKGVNVQGVSANTQTSAVSRYTVTIDTSYNGQRCICTASHQLWSDNKVAQSQPFVVHYPPTTNPVISGYDGSFRYKDDNLTLSCRVSGGSPLAILSWTCNEKQQPSVRQSTSGTTVTSNITVAMTKELNRKTCICHGRHSDTRYTPNIEGTQFIVYYPPSNPFVEVSPETPFPWIEGGNGKLRCSVNDGNPPVSYEWSTSDGLISGQTTNILSLSSLRKNDNRKEYKCKVVNAYTTAKNLNLISVKELDVEYNPVVYVGETPAYVRETDTFKRICAANGNPPPTKTWVSSSSSLNGDTLQLVNIMKNQTGDYTCRAQAQSNGAHGLLSGQAVLKVIVQYPVTVQAMLDKTSITEGQAVSMFCLARGVPDQYTYGGWVQIYKNTVIRSESDFVLSLNKRNLTLSGVTYQDIGTYQCRAHNTVTDKYGILYQRGSTDLDIKFSAVFNSSRKFYLEINKTVDIKILFFANPVLQNTDSVSLTKQNINQKQRSDIQIQIEKTNLDIVFHGKTINVEGQEIIILMIPFNNELEGNYTAGVKNYDGAVSSFVFQVAQSGPPEHPQNFHIIKSTADSVVVTWLGGNNKGHQQTFVISYQQTGKIDTLKTQNITESDKQQNYTETISNLNPETQYSFWIHAYNEKGSTKQDIGSFVPDVIITQKLKHCQTDCSGYCDNRIVIGIVIGFIVGLCVEGFVISFWLWRKGFWNKCKCVLGEESVKDDNQQKPQYEDIKNEREDPNLYDGIHSEGPENNQESSRNNDEYEQLDNRPESTAYLRLEQKGAENIEMSSVYVNTIVK